MVDQIVDKFSVGDIVRSIAGDPVKECWRNIMFEVVEITRRDYKLKPLELPSSYPDNDLEPDGTVFALIEHDIYLRHLDGNDIEWWMNNNA